MAPGRGEQDDQQGSILMWKLAVEALEAYSLDMKRSHWPDAEQVCLAHTTAIARHISRLPHNAPTNVLPKEKGSSERGASAHELVRDLMAALVDHLKVEEFLAPVGFRESMKIAVALAQAELSTAELAILLSAAPDWRIVQASDWFIGESLERFTAFLRWEAGIVENWIEVNKEFKGVEAVTVEAIGTHGKFLVDASKYVDAHARLMTASLPKGHLTSAVAGRMMVASLGLNKDADDLLAAIENTARRNANFVDASAKRADQEKNPSILGQFLHGNALQTEIGRRLQVEKDLTSKREVWLSQLKDEEFDEDVPYSGGGSPKGRAGQTPALESPGSPPGISDGVDIYPAGAGTSRGGGRGAGRGQTQAPADGEALGLLPITSQSVAPGRGQGRGNQARVAAPENGELDLLPYSSKTRPANPTVSSTGASESFDAYSGDGPGVPANMDATLRQKHGRK